MQIEICIVPLKLPGTMSLRRILAFGPWQRMGEWLLPKTKNKFEFLLKTSWFRVYVFFCALPFFCLNVTASGLPSGAMTQLLTSQSCQFVLNICWLHSWMTAETIQKARTVTQEILSIHHENENKIHGKIYIFLTKICVTKIKDLLGGRRRGQRKYESTPMFFVINHFFVGVF